MTPNCVPCNNGDHTECDQRGRMRGVVCECQCGTATQARKMLRAEPPATPATDIPPPPYVILDLWMALGHENNHEFEDALAVRGMADVWAILLSEVRALNNRGIEEPQAENGDPLYQQAKAEIERLRTYDEIDVRTDYSEVVTNARGERVMGTLRHVITIEGTL